MISHVTCFLLCSGRRSGHGASASPFPHLGAFRLHSHRQCFDEHLGSPHRHTEGLRPEELLLTENSLHPGCCSKCFINVNSRDPHDHPVSWD